MQYDTIYVQDTSFGQVHKCLIGLCCAGDICEQSASIILVVRSQEAQAIFDLIVRAEDSQDWHEIKRLSPALLELSAFPPSACDTVLAACGVDLSLVEIKHFSYEVVKATF